MFAVAIVDRRDNPARLLIVRDRVGIKPLYYAESSGRLIFGSEIKALLTWPGLAREIDLDAIGDYLALRYVPGPGCLIRGVRKLPAGHMLVCQQGQLSIRQWWELPTPPPAHGMSSEEASHTFGQALRNAVRSHLVSDVPIGAFLSGGVDSSVIVALMAEVASRPVHTFSIGFPDFPKDELQRAALTAQTFATHHTPVECRAADMAALPDIAWSLDEPVGDPIIVPLDVLSREARRTVKVVLSGEGADEVLGGYVFHRNLLQMERLQRLLPRRSWSVISRLVRATPVSLLDRAFDYPGRLGTEGRGKIAALIGELGHADLLSLYRASISLFDPPDIHALAIAPQPATPRSQPISCPWIG
jgi:asparagine synthase (glutamine-hydrolysing)